MNQRVLHFQHSFNTTAALMDTAGSTTQTQQSTHLTELKEIVSNTLEKNGILAKAQAQLRKHVFEALSLTEQEDQETYNTAPQIDENDINDQFAMALIRDFLSYHHLDYTLSLMNTECQKKLNSAEHITRNEIASRLGLGAQKPSPDSSLLKQLVSRLFDEDVLKPLNSTLPSDIKLKPRNSTDPFRTPPAMGATAKAGKFKPASSATMDDLDNVMSSVSPFKRDPKPLSKANVDPQEDRTVIDPKKYTNPLFVSSLC